MGQRKYFKYRINELEDLHENEGDDIAVLEELEGELHHRSTQRARKLLSAVQKSISSGPSAGSVRPVQAKPIKTKSGTTKSVPSDRSSQSQIKVTKVPMSESMLDDEDQIDWNVTLRDSYIERADSIEEHEAQTFQNNPTDILDVWTVLEALSPQVYKRPNDLVIGQGSVAYLKKGKMPWERGEKSRPKANLYYILYLGAVDVEKSTQKLLAIYQDKRIERTPTRGFAALGVILLDKNGIPLPDIGLALSSFGWSFGRALQEKLHDLKSWGHAEKLLTERLDKYIYRENKDGELLPFSLNQAEHIYQWLLRNCEIPTEDAVAPSFAIRLYQPFSRGEPEPPLMNSFYLEDLQKAKHAVQANTAGDALSLYLGITKPEQCFDILGDKKCIEDALQPKYTPAARWPSNGRYPLVLLQQTAVHLAKKQLVDGGFFSVNGPPGTGKTTLLRDVVASVLVDRANALCAFKNTDDAFEHAGQMRLGNGFVHLYKLDESLRGHEILVASTNNKAVENVSKELPLKEQFAQDAGDFQYFKTVSDALASGDEETWGLCAAVLGNSKNRSQFINKAWWDGNSGLRNYLLSITGQLNLEVDDEGDEIIPKVIEECDPPKSIEEAKCRWLEARKSFKAASKKAQDAIDQAQLAYESKAAAGKLSKKIRQLQDEHRILETEILNSENVYASLSEDLVVKDFHVKSLETDCNDLRKIKLGFFKRLVARSEWREWKKRYKEVDLKLTQALRGRRKVQVRADQCRAKMSQVCESAAHLEASIHTLELRCRSLLCEVEKYSSICGDMLVTDELWSLEHDQQQIFAPNFTAEAQRLRDDVFIAAIRLHKAFIDASSKKLRQNLGAFFSCLSGKDLPANKQSLLPHLWTSAFILTPVMSTAFASVGRMLKPMPKESIGWLLIDEAGQATPQAAIGAIYRSKRVMCVGDPLQIEPVVTLSASLVEVISTNFGVDPYYWIAPDASVQTLADEANCFGTTIPRELSEIRIGSPLLVHRRCEDPMFTISNRLAYNGLMVQATVSNESDITALYGKQSQWFDIQGSAQEKWCPEEGELVAQMLLKRFAASNGNPEIYVISPFKIVAEKMSQRMRIEEHRLREFGIENPNDWVYNNIGTVHTFQGKETKAVILLLGATDPSQTGARNWATSNVNLLNVAVSRAKQNFYVVGNRSLWGDLGNMKYINRYIGK